MFPRAIVTIVVCNRRNEITGKELHQSPVHRTRPVALQATQCALGGLVKLTLAIDGELMTKMPKPGLDIVGIHEAASRTCACVQDARCLENRSGELI